MHLDHRLSSMCDFISRLHRGHFVLEQKQNTPFMKKTKTWFISLMKLNCVVWSGGKGSRCLCYIVLIVGHSDAALPVHTQLQTIKGRVSYATKRHCSHNCSPSVRSQNLKCSHLLFFNHTLGHTNKTCFMSTVFQTTTSGYPKVYRHIPRQHK